MTFSTDLFLEYKKRPGKAALARLLERHQDAVYSVCHHVLRHPQDAEDACQEVLLEVARQVNAIEEPEAAEALHEGLAGLDDASRTLVVEHYFGQRPLRELAAERGCSEVAVWKRIQSARERLKKSLGSAVVSALDGIATVHAPAGLAKQALLRGGLTMAASAGIKLAIVAPLVLLAGGGVVMMARRPDPAPPVAPAKTAPPRRPLESAGTAGATSAGTKPAAKPVALVPAAPPESRRPYPLKIPAAAARSQAAEQTWGMLHAKRVTIDEQNVSIYKILRQISQETGIAIVVDPDVREVESVSFKVQDIVVDGALRLMLQPRNRGYEVRPDGAVIVAPPERLSREFQEARKVGEALQELDSVRSMLDAGWDGLRDPAAPQVGADDIRAKKIVVPQGETSLREEFQRLRQEYEVYVFAQIPRAGIGVGAGKPSALDERFPQLVGERSIGEHLEQLASRAGLTVLHAGGNIFRLTTPEAGQSFRAAGQEVSDRYQKSLETLTKSLPETGTLLVQDLLDSIPRTLGVKLLADQASWDSGASVTLRSGATLREALDAIKAQGFRWASYQEKIFVLK